MQLTTRTSATDPLQLTSARVHEAEGAGRRVFALFQAAQLSGPVIWIQRDHQSERLLLSGLPTGLGNRLQILRARKEADLLWAAEEALRASPVSLVVAEPMEVLSLTEGRRLQLAAEAGQTTGLMLVREGQGSNAAETRWTCAPMLAERLDSPRHFWSLDKNKKGTLGAWMVDWNGKTSSFHAVSTPRERSRSESAPD